jgi:chromosome segregation ATPase
VPYRKIAVSNSSLRMELRRLTDILTAVKGDLEEANQQHGNSTQIIVRLEKEVASANKRVEALVDVGDGLELTSVILVDTQDELVAANNHIKRKNEAMTIIRGKLKEAQESTTCLSLARDRLIDSTKAIRVKAQAHDDDVDKMSTASRKLFGATQDFSLKTNEIAAISLDLIRLKEHLHEATLSSESLKEELLERTTDLMAVHKDNEILRGMQLLADVWRGLDEHCDGEHAIETTFGGSDKGSYSEAGS